MAILTDSDQSRIDAVIQDLQLRLGFSYPEMSILDLAKSAGVQVYEVDLSQAGASGVIQYDDEEQKTNPRIYLNSNMSPQRKVFTLAHELGHHFLHKGEKWRLDTFDYSNDDQITKEESEANYFAASILVPKKLLLYRMQKGDSIAQLAEYFKVSVPVIENRIRWININGH